MNVAKAFGLVLKQARTDAELTQDELAARAGYTREFVSLLERGQRQPTLKTVFDLADTLDVSALEIVKRVQRKL